MKRALALALALFCMMSLFACPAPTPDAGGSTTTTTTSGNGGDAPTAPLVVTPASPYLLVGEEMTFTVSGAESGEFSYTFSANAVTDATASGTTVTATAAAVGVCELTVTAGTRTASAVVTVYPDSLTELPATAPYVELLGRTETNAAGDVLLNNTASGFEVTFYGKSLLLKMCNAAGKSDTAKFAVYIDGEGDPAVDQIDLRTAGTAVDGTREILICSFDVAGVHTVRLQKITQESLASAVFTSVAVEGGFLSPDEEEEPFRLMIYGDSITCGHSNMRPDSASDTQNSTNENGMLTYAMRAAAMLDADAHVFARSGLGLYTNPYNSTLWLKDIYNKVSPASKTEWDMTSWVPDAVVINIGTNDIWATSGSTGNAPYTKAGFIDAYVAMVLEMVEIWGDNTTFFLCTSMMAGNLDADVQAVAARLVNEYGLAVYYVDLPMRQNPSGHPTNASHEAAAEVLYLAIAEKMGIY